MLTVSFPTIEVRAGRAAKRPEPSKAPVRPSADHGRVNATVNVRVVAIRRRDHGWQRVLTQMARVLEAQAAASPPGREADRC